MEIWVVHGSRRRPSFSSTNLLPNARQSIPGVFAGSTLVFIPALGAFAVSDILGGTDGLMIGNLISQQFLGSRDWPFGSVLSIVLTVLALGVKRLHGMDRAPENLGKGRSMKRKSLGLWLAACTTYIFLYIPLLIVVVYSFNDSRFKC